MTSDIKLLNAWLEPLSYPVSMVAEYLRKPFSHYDLQAVLDRASRKR